MITKVSATEGGHIDFAPLDQIEDAILARLRKRHMRVSVERVVSGPGIVDIYATLAALGKQQTLGQAYNMMGNDVVTSRRYYEIAGQIIGSQGLFEPGDAIVAQHLRRREGPLVTERPVPISAACVDHQFHIGADRLAHADISATRGVPSDASHVRHVRGWVERSYVYTL